jgi:hypothetical protein
MLKVEAFVNMETDRITIFSNAKGADGGRCTQSVPTEKSAIDTSGIL